jgi:hypothetical protein
VLVIEGVEVEEGGFARTREWNRSRSSAERESTMLQKHDRRSSRFLALPASGGTASSVSAAMSLSV